MLLNPALDVPAEAGAELLADADILVPVPLTRRRLLSRRFNQSALLAQEVAHIAHIEVESLALLRVRSTKAQVGLSRQQRRENVANAFAVAPARKDAIASRKVVLIDDVITTGATAEACARALKRAGAARVDVLVLALVTDAAAVAA
jgi:ComF family protein